METSESIGKLAEALAKAQGAIQNAAMDAKNPAFKKGSEVSKYATLASVWNACRSSLSANGVAVIQAPGTDDSGAVTITTTLCHTSGEWMRSEMACRPASPTAQAMGSVVTYLRRYSLAAMVGVAPDDDDDGNAGSGTLSPVGARNHAQAPTDDRQIGSGTQPKPQSTPFDDPTTAEKPKTTPLFERDTFILNTSSPAAFVEIYTKAVHAAPTQAALSKMKSDNRGHLVALPDDLLERCNNAFELRMGFWAGHPTGSDAKVAE